MSWSPLLTRHGADGSPVRQCVVFLVALPMVNALVGFLAGFALTCALTLLVMA